MDITLRSKDRLEMTFKQECQFCFICQVKLVFLKLYCTFLRKIIINK